MHHNISLITTIAAALGFGLIFGMLAVRCKLPALVGYLAAASSSGRRHAVADMAPAGELGEQELATNMAAHLMPELKARP